MALFFFHLLTESERHDDPFGLELPTVEAAYLQAVASAPELACELLRDGEDVSRCSFEITDERGAVLLSIDFAELQSRKREPASLGGTTRRLVSAIEASHQQVVCAREQLSDAIVAARTSLQESQAMLAAVTPPRER